MNKKTLAILLSQISSFEKPIVKLEQYQTPSEIAAEILWFISFQNELENKLVADLGCGTGILGLGASVLGAKKVYMIDSDKGSIELAKQNKKSLEEILSKKLNCIISEKDISKFNKKVDLIIQNPPFGVKAIHSDRKFLKKAFSLAPLIYSFHKIESKNFLKSFSRDNNFKSELIMKFNFPLPKTYSFHKKKIHIVKVGLWRFEKS